VDELRTKIEECLRRGTGGGGEENMEGDAESGAETSPAALEKPPPKRPAPKKGKGKFT